MISRNLKAILFTLIELLIVITIIAILASMLLPVLRNGREQGLAIKCTGNLKQIGVLFSLYAADYEEYLCPHMMYYNSSSSTYWVRQFVNAGYIINVPVYEDRSKSLLLCPSEPYRVTSTNESYGQYGYNVRIINKQYVGNGVPGLKIRQVAHPSSAYLIIDKYFASNGDDNNVIIYDRNDYTNGAVSFRHSSAANILYADFHVKKMKAENVPARTGGQLPWYNQ